jgi:hypothetical protein
VQAKSGGAWPDVRACYLLAFDHEHSVGDVSLAKHASPHRKRHRPSRSRMSRSHVGWIIAEAWDSRLPFAAFHDLDSNVLILHRRYASARIRPSHPVLRLVAVELAPSFDRERTDWRAPDRPEPLDFDS